MELLKATNSYLQLNQIKEERNAQIENFIETLINSEDNKSSHFNVLTEEKYNELLSQVVEAKRATKKSPMQYRRLKRFNTVELDGVPKLIAKLKNDDIKYYVKVNEVYDILETAHLCSGHGGRDKIKFEISKNYANITVQAINLFLSMCEFCQQRKSKINNKSPVLKPNLPNQMNSCCQLDFIDMHPQRDGQYKLILIYEDNFTKFVLLRALKSRLAEEIAYQLNDIFLTFGAPAILQSRNNNELMQSVVMKLSVLWGDLTYKFSDGNEDEDCGLVDHQDIKDMVEVWMKDSNSSAWSQGLRLIQFMRNRSFNKIIKQSPYKAMFGMDPVVDINTTPLLPEIVLDVKSERFDSNDGSDQDNEDGEFSKLPQGDVKRPQEEEEGDGGSKRKSVKTTAGKPKRMKK